MGTRGGGHRGDGHVREGVGVVRLWFTGWVKKNLHFYGNETL